MTGQRIAESLVDAFVDQDVHLGTREKQVFCFFESSDSGFTRHGGKSLQKVFECLSVFQIVEEGLDWHTRSTKDRTSAKNIRVFDDNSHGKIVSRRVQHLKWRMGRHRLIVGGWSKRSKELPTLAQNKIAKGRPPGAVSAF